MANCWQCDDDAQGYIAYISNADRFMSRPFYTSLVFTSLAIGMLGTTSCHPAYKATATTRQVQKSLCAEEWLSFPDQPHPMFEEFVSKPLTNEAIGFAVPKKYVRYKVSEDTLKALFTYLRSPNKKGGIVLPIEKHCEPFELKVSGAMISALNDKYPEIVSLQGRGTTNKTADARIDWTGRQMRAQISYNGATYFIASVVENNEISYLIYNREDSGEAKQPFEQKPATPATNNNKVYYDR